jgi:hypothetical protein
VGGAAIARTCIRDVRLLLYSSCTQHSTPDTVFTSSSSPAAASLPAFPPAVAAVEAALVAEAAPADPVALGPLPAPAVLASRFAASSSNDRCGAQPTSSVKENANQE